MAASGDDVLLALLAVRSAVRGRAAPLWRILAAHPEPESLVLELSRTVRSEHVRAARKQLQALPLFDIQLVPVWALPSPLKRARPTPAALFVRGEAALLSRPAVAIVGTRQASASALEWARTCGQVHARAGTLVVSGGARGVDSAAHRGALEAGGVTLAYIGVPADEIYPRQNERLFRTLLGRGGAIVSEHPPGVVTYKGEHAMRNRFIAAHASQVVIVEADSGSGALVTADFADKLGVPVWVSPPGVGALRAGIEALLRRGRAQIWQTRSGSRP
jgi:DNA processing protein